MSSGEAASPHLQPEVSVSHGLAAAAEQQHQQQHQQHVVVGSTVRYQGQDHAGGSLLTSNTGLWRAKPGGPPHMPQPLNHARPQSAAVTHASGGGRPLSAVRPTAKGPLRPSSALIPTLPNTVSLPQSHPDAAGTTMPWPTVWHQVCGGRGAHTQRRVRAVCIWHRAGQPSVAPQLQRVYSSSTLTCTHSWRLAHVGGGDGKRSAGMQAAEPVCARAMVRAAEGVRPSTCAVAAGGACVRRASCLTRRRCSATRHATSWLRRSGRWARTSGSTPTASLSRCVCGQSGACGVGED